MSASFERIRDSLAERYLVQRELGQGGMATVYLAADTRHDRDVAVKVMRSEFVDSVGAERFLREIAVSSRLSHPNVVPLFDSGEVDGIPYYVMPFIAGESLRQRLDREHQLTLSDAV